MSRPRAEQGVSLYIYPAHTGPAVNYPLASRNPPHLIFPMPRKRKVREIVEEARQLPYGKRAELIERLIADSARDIDPKIEKAWGDVAMRRLKEIEKDKSVLVPGAVAMARVRKTVGL